MTTTDAPTIPRHPAKFSAPILDTIRKLVALEAEQVGHLTIFDPFAGVGGVHDLADAGWCSTVGVELQPEWAAAHPDTIVGDALALPADWTDRFDVLVTSPCYGNRMADAHEARDPCRADGCVHGVYVVEGEPPVACPACKGSGLSRRNTYAHALRESGADVADGSAAVLQWGPRYRAFHEAAWREADRCIRPGGLAVVNVKNHRRSRGKDRPAELVRVVEFHLNVWLLLGYTLQEARPVPTRGNRQGANRDVREDHEMVLALRKPAAS